MKTNQLLRRASYLLFILFLCVSFQNANAAASITIRVKCNHKSVANNTPVYIFAINPSTGVPEEPICVCTLIGCRQNSSVFVQLIHSGSVTFNGLPNNKTYQVVFGITCSSNLQNNNCVNTTDCVASLSAPAGITTFATGTGGNLPQLPINICLPDRISAADAPAERLSIYPNPAQQMASIDVSGYEGMVQLQVINALGQQVFSKAVELNGEEIYSLDVSALAKGIYKVVLLNDAELSTGMFVKE
jgi:hypothetical protein